MSRESWMLVLGIYFGLNVGFVLGAFWRSLFSPSPSPEARDQ